MKSAEQPRRPRGRAALLCLSSLAFLWVVLALVARIPTTGATQATNVLFTIVVPLSYALLSAFVILASSRPRLMALRAAATTLALSLILAVLEGSAALRLTHWELLFRALSNRGSDDYGTAYVPDPELIFKRIPLTRWSGRPPSDIERSCGVPASLRRPITFTYDRWGYRNTTEMARAEVVLIGDSYVEGWYVSDEQTVARRLQDRLGAPVANLGVAGYGTKQELIVLKREAVRLGAETVIWIFFEGNDLYDDQEFENALLTPPSASTEEPQRAGLTRGHGWWRRSFLRNGLSDLRALLHSVVPIQCRYCADVAIKGRSEDVMCFFDYAQVPWSEFERSRWEKTKRTLVEAMKFTHDRGMHLLLAYAPIKFRVYRNLVEFRLGDQRREWGLWPLPELFVEFCRVQGLACLDLTEPLRRAVRDGGLPYPWNDTHWSVEGHDLVAAKLQEELRARGWAGSRRTSSGTHGPGCGRPVSSPGAPPVCFREVPLRASSRSQPSRDFGPY